MWSCFFLILMYSLISYWGLKILKIYLKKKISLKRLLKITLGSLCVTVSLVGILLYLNLKKGEKLDNVTTIEINDEITKNLNVDLKDIAPGTKTKYLINIEGLELSSFNVSLSFYEKNNPGTLSEYLTLSLTANDFNVTKSLKEILNNKDIYELGNDVKQISLVYLMDESVGNEAQDTYANFYIDLKASKKEETTNK